ncbi:GtrA family protein [Sediminibacillus dalangtanensis]|uniref:GtrA family protein n=1 Tax=Sediminibacillus dalangtanensis TaxID=2729421 RepID=A0ABX7VW36_9BACI|nr:GtrA family protein [Sediminibacillus dalangtanensis]QTN00240.1 GtrA family protein [Sediminibacillus dalangtanensis]
MAKKVKAQILQFSFIGLANAAIDIGVLNLLLWIWPTEETRMLFILNTIAYFLAILNSYIWNVKYTFSHHARVSTKEIGLFTLQAIVAWVINNVVFIGLSKLLFQFSALPLSSFFVHNIAKGAAMFLSFSTSFLLMKFIVFRKKKIKKVMKKR